MHRLSLCEGKLPGRSRRRRFAAANCTGKSLIFSQSKAKFPTPSNRELNQPNRETNRRNRKPPRKGLVSPPRAVRRDRELAFGSGITNLTSVLPSIRRTAQAVAETQTTTVSTKGQVILPKAIRQRRNWQPGTRLMVEDTPEGVLLTAAPVFAPTRPVDVAGMLAYRKPPKTLEEMDAAITSEVTRRRARGRY
jgi:AbrB family looped-hinge helix DNA binding protein